MNDVSSGPAAVKGEEWSPMSGWILFGCCFSGCALMVYLVSAHGFDYFAQLYGIPSEQIGQLESTAITYVLLAVNFLWVSFLWKDPVWESSDSKHDSDPAKREVIIRVMLFTTVVLAAWSVCDTSNFWGSVALVGALSLIESVLVMNHVKRFEVQPRDAWTFVTALAVMSSIVYLAGEAAPLPFSRPLHTSPFAAGVINVRMWGAAVLWTAWLCVTVAKAVNRVHRDRNFIQSLQPRSWVESKTSKVNHPALRILAEAAIIVGTLFLWVVFSGGRWVNRLIEEVGHVIAELLITMKLAIAMGQEISRIVGLVVLSWTAVWTSGRLIEYCHVGHGAREWWLFAQLGVIALAAAAGFYLVALGALRRFSMSTVFYTYYFNRWMIICGTVALVGALTPLTGRLTEGFRFPGPVVVVALVAIVATMIYEKYQYYRRPAITLHEPIRIIDLARAIGSDSVVQELRESQVEVGSVVTTVDRTTAASLVQKRGFRLKIAGRRTRAVLSTRETADRDKTTP